MDPRIRNLIVAGLVPLVLLFFVFRSTASDEHRMGGDPVSITPAPEPSAPVPTDAGGSGDRRWYSHALDLLEVDAREASLRDGPAHRMAGPRPDPPGTR